MQLLPRPDRQPHLRPLRRPDGSVQVGVGPRSLRLIGLTDEELRWLTAIDPARELTESMTTAALEGIDPGRATEILDRFVAGGLLHPVAAADPPEIAVVGSGALPALLVDVLRQSERVHATRVRPGAEVRAGSVAEVLRGAGDETAATPHLAVVVSGAPASPESTGPWLATGTPVLPVWCLPDQASIGPLLQARGGPCLTCLELTRVGVDPGWPWLRAQLTRPHVSGPERVDGLPGLRLLAAGLVTTLVLDHAAGRMTAPEWSFEVATPGPTLERHRWPAHPRCEGCGSRGEAATPADDGSSTRTGWSDTMTG